VIVTETVDERTSQARALDPPTARVVEGDLERRQQVIAEAKPRGEFIRPPPASMGKVVIVGGMRDLLLWLRARMARTLATRVRRGV